MALERHTGDQYGEQVQSHLIPPGRGLSKRADSIVGKLLRGVGDEFERLEASADDLLTESVPSDATAAGLLGDWERVFDVDGAGLTETERQAQIVARANARAQVQTDAYLESVAAQIGATVDVREIRQRNCAVMTPLMPFFEYGWPWRPVVFGLDFAAGSTLADRVQAELERVRPANVVLEYRFPQLPLACGFEDPSWLADSGLDYWVLPDAAELTRAHWAISGVPGTLGAAQGAVHMDDDPGTSMYLYADLQNLSVAANADTDETLQMSLLCADAVAGPDRGVELWLEAPMASATDLYAHVILRDDGNAQVRGRVRYTMSAGNQLVEVSILAVRPGQSPDLLQTVTIDGATDPDPYGPLGVRWSVVDNGGAVDYDVSTRRPVTGWDTWTSHLSGSLADANYVGVAGAVRLSIAAGSAPAAGWALHFDGFRLTNGAF